MILRLVLSVLMSSLALSGLSAAAAHAADRPNILFAIADDWGHPYASAYGDPVVKTPHFDRVAREGVLFRNAFIAAPSCSPSRAAILTGQWHWRLEDGANLHGFIPPKFDVFPDLLEKSGYVVGMSKKGYGPGSLGGRARNPAGPNFKSFDDFLAQRDKSKPFCFWYGSQEPHRPYKPGSGKAAGLDTAKVKLPPFWPDNDVVRCDLADYLAEVQQADGYLGELIAALEKTGELEHTIIVVTGDHNTPFPRGKANLYDQGTHVPLAIRWPGKIKAGRVVDDFVSLADLAPTFLEAAGLKPTSAMTARSLMNVLLSEKSGLVDASRDHVIFGMERHVPCRKIDNGKLAGYPCRAIRTGDHLLIRNFAPDRWPAGDPNGLEKAGAQPFTERELSSETRVALADCDSGATKAWIVLHRDEPAVRPLYDLCFGKRPAVELYDLKKDPHQVRNVADDPAYAAARRELEAKLMAQLKATNDPRVAENSRAPLDELPANAAGKAKEKEKPKNKATKP